MSIELRNRVNAIEARLRELESELALLKPKVAEIDEQMVPLTGILADLDKTYIASGKRRGRPPKNG
jgi:uncharacterized coiled-coil protein SlyX